MVKETNINTGDHGSWVKIAKIWNHAFPPGQSQHKRTVKQLRDDHGGRKHGKKSRQWRDHVLKTPGNFDAADIAERARVRALLLQSAVVVGENLGQDALQGNDGPARVQSQQINILPVLPPVQQANAHSALAPLVLNNNDPLPHNVATATLMCNNPATNITTASTAALNNATATALRAQDSSHATLGGDSYDVPNTHPAGHGNKILIDHALTNNDTSNFIVAAASRDHEDDENYQEDSQLYDDEVQFLDSQSSNNNNKQNNAQRLSLAITDARGMLIANGDSPIDPRPLYAVANAHFFRLLQIFGRLMNDSKPSSVETINTARLLPKALDNSDDAEDVAIVSARVSALRLSFSDRTNFLASAYPRFMKKGQDGVLSQVLFMIDMNLRMASIVCGFLICMANGVNGYEAVEFARAGAYAEFDWEEVFTNAKSSLYSDQAALTVPV